MAFEVDPKWIKLFRTLQFIFLVTVFFLSAVYYSLNISFKLYKFIEFYFIFCLLISALLYAYLCLEFDLIKTPTNGNNLFSILTRKQIVIVVRIFISVIAVRFLFNSEYTLWADELLQHDFTNGFSVFDSAAGHQQPALPYMLSYWNIKLFGYNEFAIRGHNYAYGALLIVFLYSFLKTFKFSNLVTIFIVFAFSISPTVFQYGIESRPISFGLIFGIFTIFEILFRLNQRNFSWKSIGSVFLFALLLLISVGFQAPVFVGSLAFICLFISSEKTSLKLKLFFALIVALLCFLPIQYYIYQISSNYLKPVAPSGLHLDVLKNFANQFWYSVLRTDLTFLNPIELAGLIGILGLGLYFFDKKKTSFVKSTLELRRILIVGIYGISFTFLFLIFAHAAFVIAVQWNFNSRYLALFNIPFFLSAAALITFVTLQIEKFSSIKNLQNALKYCAFFLVGFIFFLRNSFPQTSIYLRDRDAIKKAIQDLSPVITGDDVFFPVCLYLRPRCWDYSIWIKYLEINQGEGMKPVYRDPISFTLSKIDQKQKVDKAFFFISPIPFIERKVLNLSESTFKDYDNSLLLVVSGPNKWQQLAEIIARIRTYRNQVAESDDSLFIVPEFIAQVGINNKNYKIDQKLLIGGLWEISSIQRFLINKDGKDTK